MLSEIVVGVHSESVCLAVLKRRLKTTNPGAAAQANARTEVTYVLRRLGDVGLAVLADIFCVGSRLPIVSGPGEKTRQQDYGENRNDDANYLLHHLEQVIL